MSALRECIMRALCDYSESQINLGSEAAREQLTNNIMSRIEGEFISRSASTFEALDTLDMETTCD